MSWKNFPRFNDLFRISYLRSLICVLFQNAGSPRPVPRAFLTGDCGLEAFVGAEIVGAAGCISGGRVCEIGPGPGGLTRAILESGVSELVVIEKDGRFLDGIKLLAETCPEKVRIVHSDILRFDVGVLWPSDSGNHWFDEQPNVHFIGNLPFNVATPLIIRWLEAMSNRSGPFTFGRCGLTLTFQKEVAERMVAPIDDSQRCRLSIMCQYLAHVKHKFTISGAAFVPAPKVDVGVVCFEPREEPLIKVNFKVVEKFCRHLFVYRRKYSIRGIQTLYPPEMEKEFAPEIYRRARVNPKARSYELGIKEIRDMCSVYEEQCQRVKGLFYFDYVRPKSWEELEKLENPWPPKYLFENEDFQETTLHTCTV